MFSKKGSEDDDVIQRRGVFPKPSPPKEEKKGA